MLKLILIFLCFGEAATVKESIEFVKTNTEFVNISKVKGLKFDLRYASTNNFVGENMYGEFQTPYLHKLAYEKLLTAIKNLRLKHKGYGFLIFDSLRPRSVQRILYSKVKGTDKEIYVADPDKGSMHNYGMALDLTVIDGRGKELDMGTPFDFFGELAQPKFEEKFMKSGDLKPQQQNNRLILRNAMTSAGFIQLPHEWWHYNAFEQATVKAKYKIVE